MNIIQYLDSNKKNRVGLVRSADEVVALERFTSVYELAQHAIATGVKLVELVKGLESVDILDYQNLVNEGRLLAPLLHPESSRMLIAGTGLTHLGSADTRAAMHSKLQADEAELTDSMKMFRMGVEGGKPLAGETGVQPEWFYKGDGDIVLAPGQPIQSPGFGLDLGDEAEIVGLYLIGDDCKPYRVGYALGNEFSDHKMERINYLYLAHSKLRPCSYGPEILLGELPERVSGMSRIIRNGKTLWEKEFLSGETNMSHTIANLEYHHFKYKAFLRPGDVHVHYFGTGTLSFGDGIETQPGDLFQLESETFGRALNNEYQLEKSESSSSEGVTTL